MILGKEVVIANLIEVIISAQDNASNVLKSITGSLNNVGDGAIKLGTSLTLATAPLAGFLGAALKQASDQETAFSQLNAVLKSTGGVAGVTAQAADELSSSLAKVTRFSDDAVLGAESMLLTFTSISRDIFPEVTKTALDMSQALGQDLKSSSIQLGKALNSPIEGITALRRVGVQFTDAQEAMIKTMVESGNLMGAQKLILAELGREFGGSAEAAGKTFAGALDIINHKFEDFQEKIGFMLMPTLGKVIDVAGRVIDRVVAWTEKNPALTRTIVAIASALVVAGPVLIGVGTAIKLVTSETGAFRIALTALSGPVGIIIAGIAALALAYTQNFMGLKDTLAPVLKTLSEGFATIGRDVDLFIARLKEGGISEALGGLFSKFEDGSSTIKNLLESFGVIPSAAEAVATAISDAFAVFAPAIKTAQGVIDYFVQSFQTNIALIPFYAQYYIGGIWDAVRPGLELLANWFTKDGLPAVVDVVQNHVMPIFGKFVQFLSGIWTIVSPALGQLFDWFVTKELPNILDFISGTIIPGIGAFFDLISGVWDVVSPALTALFDWFVTSGLPAIENAVDTTWGIVNNFIDLLKGLWAAVSPALESLKNGMQAIFGWINDNIIQPVVKTINDLITNINLLKNYDPNAPQSGGGGSRGFGGDSGSGGSNPIQIIGNSVGNAVSSAIEAARTLVEIAGAGPGGLPAVSGTAAGGGASFRALGGPVNTGSPYIVGERGPEVFIPGSNGSIAPNGSGGGKEPVAVTAVFPNVTDKTSAAQFKQWMDDYFRGLLRNG